MQIFSRFLWALIYTMSGLYPELPPIQITSTYFFAS
nr:MAG TPA: hypothetical protein [Caudoviricetes sp.]